MRISASVLADSAVTVACVVVVGLSINQWNASRVAQQAPERVVSIDPVIIDTTLRPSEGSPNARVGIVEFSDFQCPFCARFSADIYPQLKREFVDTGKVRRVHMNMPLATHPAAREAAEAAECARQVDKFWLMHAKLFAHQGNLSSEAIKSYAADVGVAPASYQACMQGSAKRRIDEDLQSATALDVSNTPTFYLGRFSNNGEFVAEAKIVGAHPYEVFQEAIESLIGPADAETE